MFQRVKATNKKRSIDIEAMDANEALPKDKTKSSKTECKPVLIISWI
jgi:hypothetical protein